MANYTIDGIDFDYVMIPTAKTKVLMIKSPSGFLGCGYFDVQVANRVGDAVAIVTGVQDAEQMLAAKIVRASDRAQELGVREGMSGKEALLLIHRGS